MAKIKLAPEDRHAIETLISEVVGRRDRGEGHTMAELFTEDAVIVTPHSNMKGRAEIDANFSDPAKAAAATTRHFWSNLTLTPLDDGSVQVEAYALTVVALASEAGQGPRMMAGFTRDIVVHQDGVWLMASRTTGYEFTGRLTPLKA